MKTPIPVFAVNLACRTERRRSIEEQFAGRPEFRLTVVPGIELPNGPWALWQTFYGIVQRTDDRGCVGTGHVTDAQTDDVSLGVCLLERRYLVCDGGKQIALGQVFIVSVNLHGFDFSSQRLR